jgi:hypothetical protein
MPALGKQLAMPVVGGIAAGLIAAVADELARHDLIAIAGSAALTALVVGLLLYRMRPALAMLRNVSAAEPEPTAEHPADAASTPEWSVPPDDELTAHLAARWGVIDALPHANGHKAGKTPMLDYDLLSSARFRGLAETMPIFRDPPYVLPRALDVTSPLYRRMVASLQTDATMKTGGEQKGRPGDRPAQRPDERDTDPFSTDPFGTNPFPIYPRGWV